MTAVTASASVTVAVEPSAALDHGHEEDRYRAPVEDLACYRTPPRIVGVRPSDSDELGVQHIDGFEHFCGRNADAQLQPGLRCTTDVAGKEFPRVSLGLVLYLVGEAGDLLVYVYHHDLETGVGRELNGPLQGAGFAGTALHRDQHPVQLLGRSGIGGDHHHWLVGATG